MHVVTRFSGFASFLDFSHRLKFFRAQLVLPLVFSGINPLANQIAALQMRSESKMIRWKPLEGGLVLARAWVELL